MTAAIPVVPVAELAIVESAPVIRIAGEPMTAEAARHLTQQICVKLTDLKQLILDAYEGQAHAALGYASWEAYVDGELSMSRTYTYRLMEAARAERALTGILAEFDPELPVVLGDTLITISERTYRGLDLTAAVEEVRSRIDGPVDADSVLAVFRQVADDMRHRLPEPDETVVDVDSRHMTDLRITQITDPQTAGVAWLWESLTGWNRGWVRIVKTSDPRDILAAWSEIQARYRKHLRGEVLEGSDLSIARARASTHDPVDWQGPVVRDGVKG